MFVINEKRLVMFSTTMLLLLALTVPLMLTVEHVSLLVLSMFLTFIMLGVLTFTKAGFFSPLPLFSMMFFGYVLGGVYYSYASDSFGKFIDFTNLSPFRVIELMESSLLYAILCFVCLSLGYMLSQNVSNKEASFEAPETSEGFLYFYKKNYMLLVIPLLLVGFMYWVYVANEIAGGVWNLIIFFQAFPHMIEGTGISTLPYQLYFAGIYLWILGLQISKKRIGIVFIFFSILGLVIGLTTGRIMLSLTYLMAQVFFIALVDDNLKKKMLILFVSIMSLGFAIYFLRILSNYIFIESGSELFEDGFFNAFLFRIIGSGNVADLQQLVIIISTFEINNAMMGVTYLDTIRNSIGAFWGIEPSSVGLILKDMYFPATSGAPTPGAIGEAYANFNFAAPIVMLFIGFAFYRIHCFAMSSKSYIIIFIYAMFLVRFVFMYAKVDSTMMVNFLWGITPMLFFMALFFSFYLFTVAFKRNV